MDLCENFYLASESTKDSKRVCVSAHTGFGVIELEQLMIESLGKNIVQQTLILLPSEARIRAELYQLKAVLSEHIDERSVSI